jgi:hypothetical protein
LILYKSGDKLNFARLASGNSFWKKIVEEQKICQVLSNLFYNTLAPGTRLGGLSPSRSIPSRSSIARTTMCRARRTASQNNRSCALIPSSRPAIVPHALRVFRNPMRLQFSYYYLAESTQAATIFL